MEMTTAKGVINDIIIMARQKSFSASDIKKINEYGLDLDSMKAIANQIETHGSFGEKSWSGGIKVTELGFDNWTDTEAQNLLINSARRFAHTVVQKSFMGDKTGVVFQDKLLRNTLGGGFLLELKDYMITAYSKQLGRTVTRADMHMIYTTLAQAAGLAVSLTAKNYIVNAGNQEEFKKSMEAKAFTRQVVSQLPATSFIPMMVDTSLQAVGQDRLFSTSRYDSPVEGFFNSLPVIDLATKQFELASSIADSYKKGHITGNTYNNMFGLLPFGNTPPASALKSKLKTEAKEADVISTNIERKIAAIQEKQKRLGLPEMSESQIRANLRGVADERYKDGRSHRKDLPQKVNNKDVFSELKEYVDGLKKEMPGTHISAPTYNIKEINSGSVPMPQQSTVEPVKVLSDTNTKATSGKPVESIVATNNKVVEPVIKTNIPKQTIRAKESVKKEEIDTTMSLANVVKANITGLTKVAVAGGIAKGAKEISSIASKASNIIGKYIDKAISNMPELSLPNVSLPNVSLPNVSLPNVDMQGKRSEAIKSVQSSVGSTAGKVSSFISRTSKDIDEIASEVFGNKPETVTAKDKFITQENKKLALKAKIPFVDPNKMEAVSMNFTDKIKLDNMIETSIKSGHKLDSTAIALLTKNVKKEVSVRNDFKAKEINNMPVIYVNKDKALMYVFDKTGALHNVSPVGTGANRKANIRGEDVKNKKLDDFTSKDKVTSAGSFIGRRVILGKDKYKEYGNFLFAFEKFGGKYPTYAALHKPWNDAPDRLAALSSPSPKDNNFSFGCVNMFQKDLDIISKLTGKNGNVLIITAPSAS
jgi:hypothetical protein